MNRRDSQLATVLVILALVIAGLVNKSTFVSNLISGRRNTGREFKQYCAAGDAFDQSTKWNEALNAYSQAARILPEDAGIHIRMGDALAHLERLPDAIREYECALRLQPDMAEAHFKMAMALVKVPGRLAQARQHLQATLRLQPDHAEAREQLAHLPPDPPAAPARVSP